MELRMFTDEQINAALSRSSELKLTTADGVGELEAHGLPASTIPYARRLALANVARWAGRGETVTAVEGFAAGWLDGVTVGLELAKER